MSKRSVRTLKGQFTEGNPGGPGRPRGYRSRLAHALDHLDEADLTQIRDTIIAKAKDGDMQAAKIILDRIWPAPKGRLVHFGLCTIETVADVARATNQVIAAVANGELSLEEGDALTAMIQRCGKVHELVDVERRLRGLEELLG